MSISSKMLPLAIVGSTLIELAAAFAKPAYIIKHAAASAFGLVPVSPDGGKRINFVSNKKLPLSKGLKDAIQEYNKVFQDNIQCYRGNTVSRNMYALVIRGAKYSICEEQNLEDFLNGVVRSRRTYVNDKHPEELKDEHFMFDVIQVDAGEKLHWEVAPNKQHLQYTDTVAYREEHEDPAITAGDVSDSSEDYVYWHRHNTTTCRYDSTEIEEAAPTPPKAAPTPAKSQNKGGFFSRFFNRQSQADERIRKELEHLKEKRQQAYELWETVNSRIKHAPKENEDIDPANLAGECKAHLDEVHRLDEEIEKLSQSLTQ